MANKKSPLEYRVVQNEFGYWFCQVWIDDWGIHIRPLVREQGDGSAVRNRGEGLGMAKRADVIMATSLVRILSSIKDDGSFVEPMLETYALYLGLGLDEAEQAVEEATKLMTEEGELCEVNGELRFTERYKEFLRARKRDEQEAKQADLDKAQALDVLTGIHGRGW